MINVWFLIFTFSDFTVKSIKKSDCPGFYVKIINKLLPLSIKQSCSGIWSLCAIRVIDEGV